MMVGDTKLQTKQKQTGGDGLTATTKKILTPSQQTYRGLQFSTPIQGGRKHTHKGASGTHLGRAAATANTQDSHLM